VVLNIVSLKYVMHFLQFSFPNMTFPSTLHLFFIFLGTGFEVLTVVRIHSAVCDRTPCSLVLVMYCTAGGCFADVVLHSCTSYHQEHA
jgi:hypothetical protein